MRRLLLSISLLFIALNTISQPAFTMNDLFIHPEKPTEGDSLFLIMYIKTPEASATVSTGVRTDIEGITVADLCMYQSPLFIESRWRDTIYLGKAKSGLFRLFFAVYGSARGDTCKICTESKTYYFERRVYPVNFTILGNPVSDQLLNLTATKPIHRIDLFNAIGQPVLSTEFDLETAIQINLSHLPDGVYHIMGYFEEGQAVVKKMVKRTI